MRKRTKGKISLHRETLHQLEMADLGNAAGGDTVVSCAGTCPRITCQATKCVPSYCCP